MFEKINEIKISGLCFGNTEHTLKIFPNESQRVAIVYGQNGSGKSTVAKAFKQYSEYIDSNELLLSLIDYNNRILISKSTGDKYFGIREKIYVFNEEYILKNVGFKEDGLETIVLFDKQNEVDDEIKNQNKIKKEKNKLKDEKHLIYTKYKETSTNLKLEIINGLKKWWAPNDSQIKMNKTNTPVNESVFNEIYSLKSECLASDLQRSYDELWMKYQLLTTEKVDYPEINSINVYSEVEEKNLIIALSKKLNELKVDDNDEIILEKLQKDLNHTKDLQILLSNTETYCPYCYQKINTSYRDTLLRVIDVVLNHAVKEHSKELKEFEINQYSFNVVSFKSLDNDLCDSITNQLEKVNRIIDVYNEKIKEKEKSIYNPIEIGLLNLNGETKVLEELINKLSQKRKEYYDSFSNTNKIKNELLLINKKIASKNFEAKFAEYYKLIEKRDVAFKEVSELEKEIEYIEQKIQKLEAQKNNVEVSVNYINAALEYIFFSKNRMNIEVKNGRYIIKTRGVDVKPESISCGERNVIALCHFFSKIMEGLKEDELYTRESFVVLDDPVSSFDYDNRIGIISYLKQQTSKILNYNSNSRIIFLSHDLYTIDSIFKFIGEIRDQLAININGIPKISRFCNLCTLNNFELVQENIDNRMHVYSKLLKEVYEFALGKNIEIKEFSIGNIMRRLLEAFATFEYQKGIVDISLDPNIVENIPREKRHFFESLMYRLVLHEESHTEDHINSADVNFYIHNTTKDKIKTAQYILCLIYALNPLHLKMRFMTGEMKECKDAIINIEKWYDEIDLK